MAIRVNGREAQPPSDPRVSLLDFLREHLELTGTKKGCNQGACGACTVIVDGERRLSCLALAVQYDGRDVTTIEGLSANERLHPLQARFIEVDGFQCGYCTPGQIMSGVALRTEMRRGAPSNVSPTIAGRPEASLEEIRERMSGNICRCGAHNGIIEAVAGFVRENG
jgi:xanthine dehydrogenase YagT iron-sulfur-binding subunit